MIYAYVVLQLAMFLLSLGGYFQVKQFLDLHRSILHEQHLNEFKSLVRLNMYLSLVCLALGIPTVLLSIYFAYEYGLIGTAAVVALSVPQLLFGKHLRTLEEQARQLECTHDLSHEFRSVGEAWFNKALPNF